MKSTAHPITKRKGQFSAIKLFTNETGIEEMNRIFEQRIELTQALKDEAEKVLKRKLDKEELHYIAERSIEFVKSEIEAQFLFDGSREFNLQALGVSFTDLDIAKNKLDAHPLPVIVDYREASNTFEVKDDQRNPILDQSVTYTTNSVQNKFLKACTKLVKVLNESADLGILIPSEMAEFSAISRNFIETEYNQKGEIRYIVNVLAISSIRENEFSY